MGWISSILTMIGFGWGIALGLAVGYFMFIYFEPDDVKEPPMTKLTKIDAQAMDDILPEIPLWVKNPDHEKVDWLNGFLSEIWPYMDKAVCKEIREKAQPFIDEYKPKYNLDAVQFESLTLGTLPPVLMGMKILETQEKQLIFEVAVKFAGNPDIKVAVKAYGLKAVVQLVDVQVSATARITLKPLIAVFPCFNEISVSLMEKPHVDFGLKVLNADLMAIPGLYRYVQGIINKLVSKLCLWPHKLEICLPNCGEAPKTSQGVLSVTVLKAKQLKNRDLVGKSDPYVRLVLADSTKKTRTIMNNLNPEWNETFSLVVDDPETDILDICVYDWDKVGAHDKLGVQVISLNQLSPDIEQTFTLSLLKNLNPDDPANQKNRGQLTLQLNYKPFHSHEEEEDYLEHHYDTDGRSGPLSGMASDSAPSSVPQTPGPQVGGLLLVIIHGAEDVEGKHHTNPYVKVIFRGEKKRTKIVKKNRDPRWNAEFEYLLDEPPIKDRLLLEISSKSYRFIHKTESLGHVNIDLSDVVRNRRINDKYQLLDSKSGRIHVELQWRSTGTNSLLKDRAHTSLRRATLDQAIRTPENT